MKLFEELRRRNVFRAAGLYLVGAWLAVQVAGTLLPMFDAPPWIARALVVALAIGFVPAVVLAWAFEWTPDGLRRDADAPRDAPASNRRVDRLIAAGLAVALALVLAERFWPAGEAPAGRVATRAQPSIAVLPFANLSEDKANEHFGDGLAEDLLNLLARTPGLKVAARTSSFHFKGRQAPLAEIAGALGVETIVDGSVRRSGDTVRVVVQLVAARDGTPLWSETYDRRLEDLFAVQDDIARNVVGELLPRLGFAAPGAATRAIDPVAYERFLRARTAFYTGSLNTHLRIKEEFVAITQAAPGFAPAFAWLARSWLNVDQSTGGPEPTSVSHLAAQAAIDRALALDPTEPAAYHALGLLRMYQGRLDEALVAYSRAIELNPALVDPRINRSRLLARLGRDDAARTELDAALRIDPLHPRVLVERIGALASAGRWRAAFDAVERALPEAPALAQISEAQELYLPRYAYAQAVASMEQLVRSSPDDAWLLEPLAAVYQTMGLHTETLVAAASVWPSSLAVTGRDAEVDRALEPLMAPGASLAQVTTAAYTRAAQRRYDDAEALLDARRTEFAGAAAPLDGTVLFASLVARHPGDPRLAPLLAHIEGNRPPFALGRKLIDAVSHLLEGRVDEALRAYGTMADEGWPGDATLGGTVGPDWLLTDPRWQPVLVRIAANRNAQIRELEALRAAKLTPAQIRREYVRRLPPDPP